MPKFRIRPAVGAPCVYYLTPHGATPQGGVRVAYRHVDVLNAMGVRAAVLHLSRGFRATWFDNATPVVSEADLHFHENDILVVPEVYGSALASLDPAVRVVVFNQGGYITFDGIDYASSAAGAPYAGVARLEAIMTVSRDSAALLELSFPGTPVAVARPVVDGEIFHPGEDPRDHVFAFAPSRRGSELNQILHVLRSRGSTWAPMPIRGMSEAHVAATLRRAPIFLSLSDRDGFGLPPAEAMACGCYVVGYAGGGGDEFFDPDHCAPTTSTAETVLALENAMQTDPEVVRARGRRASAAIRSRYTESGLREDLSALFTGLM